MIRHFLLIPLLALLAACGKEDKTEEKIAKLEAFPVELTEVLSLQPQKNILLPGELKPWEKVDIYPKVKGFIKSISVDRGSVVRQGQTLAVLESPETLAELNQAYAQLSAAQSLLEEAKTKFRVSRSVYSRMLQTSKTAGAISANELEQAQARFTTDSSAVITAEQHTNSAKENYTMKKHMVNYLTISAPVNGIIMERNISPGALVGPEMNGQKPMFLLVNSAKLRLTVAVPEVYSGSIQTKNSVIFSVSSFPSRKFKADYARSAQNIDNSIRVMMTEFDVPNTDYFLKAGMYAEVKIPVQRPEPTLFLPTKSVITSSEKVFVIKNNEGHAQWVEVKKGIVSDTLTEVFGDIKKGDKVVRKASEEIRDGQEIKIIN